MLANVHGVQVHYTDHGSGLPSLGLHGGDVDHREIMNALEPLFADRPGYRRIYPDLPGMGRAPQTLRRFQERVAPGVAHADQAALERMGARWQLSTPPEQGPAYPNPTLILAGRQDASVGYTGAWRLLDHYPGPPSPSSTAPATP
jgi:hypothetical protein